MSGCAGAVEHGRGEVEADKKTRARGESVGECARAAGEVESEFGAAGGDEGCQVLGLLGARGEREARELVGGAREAVTDAGVLGGVVRRQSRFLTALGVTPGEDYTLR